MRKIKESVVAQRIKFLEQKHKLSPGTITAELLVSDARNPKSPTHNAFVWDDSKAGHLYRLAQARTLIANVRLKVYTTQENYSVVTYVRDPRRAPKEQGYVSVDKLRTDKKLARAALELEIKQVLARFERLREIAEPLGLQARVNQMIADLQSFERKFAA